MLKVGTGNSGTTLSDIYIMKFPRFVIYKVEKGKKGNVASWVRGILLFNFLVVSAISYYQYNPEAEISKVKIVENDGALEVEEGKSMLEIMNK